MKKYVFVLLISVFITVGFKETLKDINSPIVLNALTVKEGEISKETQDLYKHLTNRKETAEDLIKERYEGKSNFKMSEKYSTGTLNSIILRQKILITTYNSANETEYDGVCAITSVTSVVMHYLFENNKYYFAQSVFDKAMDFALIKGYYIKNEGTRADSTDEIINYLFKEYDLPAKSDPTSKFHIQNKAISSANQKKPSLIALPTHMIVGKGYIEYSISYTETTGRLWWKKTKTINKSERLMIVDSGWSERYDYYYPAYKLSNLGYFWQSTDQRIATMYKVYGWS